MENVLSSLRIINKPRIIPTPEPIVDETEINKENMKVIVMAVAYERPIPMRILTDCFLVQTVSNWEMTLLHYGKASADVWKTVSLYDDPRIKFQESPERYGIYGHPNRKRFLESIEPSKEDFVLLSNDDNMYVPVFIEELLRRRTHDTGMIYWDTVHSHFKYNVLKSIVKVDRIDIGSFVVRADIAKEVGFNNFAFNGDGYYAEECARACKAKGLKIDYIPKPLFIHN
jgi:hypothetical protein